jgi:hypothetical protein
MPTTYTYRDILARLSDLERLARVPHPTERSGTWSSYDRRSRYDAEHDCYVDWDANDDGTGYIRVEDGMHVVFEQHGPGAVWRVWSAFADVGHIQIFIDGAEVPVVDLPFRDFFERHPANFNPLGITNLPELTPKLSRGRNRFIPIPYQHSCKIRLAPGWGLYYHFTHVTFPPDTQVPSYTGVLAPEDWIALAHLNHQLAQRGLRADTPSDPIAQRSVHTIVVAPHAVTTILDVRGAHMLTELAVMTADGVFARHPHLLRQLELEIVWDDDHEPSVWAPLGDFFGCVGAIHPYRTLPMGATPAQLYAHWVMPFTQRAHIKLRNTSALPVSLEWHVTLRPLNAPDGDWLRFHAKWHADALLERSQGRGRDIDWPLLHATGPGRFCGVHLHVHNRWPQPASAPVSWWYGHWDQKTIDWWWGEGDEKFFVDGEVFPSTFGTGSEDYIGYAWAAEPPFVSFESAYAAQPHVPIDGNGHTSVCRFHVGDDVPFQRSFEAYIEKYLPNRGPNQHDCTYDCVVFWYQTPGMVDAYVATPVPPVD